MRTTIFAAALLLCACGSQLPGPDAAPGDLPQAVVTDARRPAGREFRVMTRNLYLGADILSIASASGPAEALAAANAAFATVQATRFPDRAAAIAREIEEAHPDVVALQEVTTWRLGPTAACLAGAPVPPVAEEVFQDFLAILRDALARRGVHYDVAAQVTSMDVELCVGDPADPATLRDLRYTDRDVMLVRRGVEWRDPTLPPGPVLPGLVPAPVAPAPGDRNGALYAVALGNGAPATAFFTVGGASDPVFSWRGWTAVEVERAGRWIRVFGTHVEDTLPSLADVGLPPWWFQALQDAQLVAIVDAVYLDPATRLPTVVVGDFNAYVEPSDPLPPTYAFLTGGSFPLDPALDGISPLRDAWPALHPRDWGFTWGFDPDLRGGHLSTRLDLVLATPELTPREIERTGVRTRTRSGLHPSDHAGLSATFRVP
jgi:endonuclease/exonuclease/phosphatase family metal-dependent hydrolase